MLKIVKQYKRTMSSKYEEHFQANELPQKWDSHESRQLQQIILTEKEIHTKFLELWYDKGELLVYKSFVSMYPEYALWYDQISGSIPPCIEVEVSHSEMDIGDCSSDVGCLCSASNEEGTVIADHREKQIFPGCRIGCRLDSFVSLNSEQFNSGIDNNMNMFSHIHSTEHVCNDVNSTEQLYNDVDGTEQLYNYVNSTGQLCKDVSSIDHIYSGVKNINHIYSGVKNTGQLCCDNIEQPCQTNNSEQHCSDANNTEQHCCETNNTEQHCCDADNTEQHCCDADNTEQYFCDADNTEQHCCETNNTEQHCCDADNTEQYCCDADNTEQHCSSVNNTGHIYSRDNNTEKLYSNASNKKQVYSDPLHPLSYIADSHLLSTSKSDVLPVLESASTTDPALSVSKNIDICSETFRNESIKQHKFVDVGDLVVGQALVRENLYSSLVCSPECNTDDGNSVCSHVVSREDCRHGELIDVLKDTHGDLRNQVYCHVKAKFSQWMRSNPNEEFDVCSLDEDLVADTSPVLETDLVYVDCVHE